MGDLEGNLERMLDAMAWAAEAEADVLVLPELATTGYPPEDLLLRESFIDGNLDVVAQLAAASGPMLVVVGFVDRVEPDHEPTLDDAVPRRLANAAALLRNGAHLGTYHKVLLPNYGVFDEDRYFKVGSTPAKTWDVAGLTIGVSVCEDIWLADGPPTKQAESGAQIQLNINASPYHSGKGKERAALLRDQAVRSGGPVVYVNLVGGQDELVFDGDSMVFDAGGELLYRAAQFEEELFWVDVPLNVRSESDIAPRTSGVSPPRLGEEAEVYAALVLGLRDYVTKNGFGSVVIGLSGGIDSALTAAIARDALGAESVWGLTMPSRYSSDGSVDDSEDLANRLGIRFDRIPIETVFTDYLTTLEPWFSATEPNVAEENLQARIRGALLMALSNKFGGIVVATGNKSEMAVGYATLYGDMAGGYSVLKDVFKTLVYRLAEWRNLSNEVIPRSIIDKAPSAELRPDQLDSDSLPDYDLLDAILELYIERDANREKIVAAGFDPELVARVTGMVDHNEYKRRQSAPGVRISRKAFGKDRRLPITNRYRG